MSRRPLKTGQSQAKDPVRQRRQAAAEIAGLNYTGSVKVENGIVEVQIDDQTLLKRPNGAIGVRPKRPREIAPLVNLSGEQALPVNEIPELPDVVGNSVADINTMLGLLRGTIASLVHKINDINEARSTDG